MNESTPHAATIRADEVANFSDAHSNPGYPRMVSSQKETDWPTDGWVTTIHQMPTGHYQFTLSRHGSTVSSLEFPSETEALDWRRDARDHHLKITSADLEWAANWALEGDLPFADNNCEELVEVLEARAEYQSITGMDTDEVNAMISNRASAEEYLIVGRTGSRDLISR